MQRLEDSLFWSSFLAFEYLRSALRTLVRLFDDVFFSGTVAVSEYLSSASRTLYFGRTFPASEYLRSASRTPLRLSQIPVQGPSTWVNLHYFEYLRKGLNQQSS